MLDKKSKCFIDFLDAQPDKQVRFFDDTEFPDEFETEQDVLAVVEYLDIHGYAVKLYSNSGALLGVKLSHAGRNLKEFSMISAKEYILDKWVAILALVISLAALVKSFFF